MRIGLSFLIVVGYFGFCAAGGFGVEVDGAADVP